MMHHDVACLSNPPKNLTLDEAKKIQNKFRRNIRKRGVLPRRIRFIAGLDSAYGETRIFSAAAAVDFKEMSLVELAGVTGDLAFPYHPGFLAFREAPSLITAAKKLKTEIDVFIVDGHGYAHPRRFGLACHVGLALDTPVIGVAKSPLTGTAKQSRIVDGDETVGAVVRSSTGKDRYVSVGHKISLEDATRIVKECMLNSNPEPIRYAHAEANRLKRRSQ